MYREQYVVCCVKTVSGLPVEEQETFRAGPEMQALYRRVEKRLGLPEGNFTDYGDYLVIC